MYQDGARRRNRIAWCDFNDPYTWIPAEDNLAGFQDLGNDETILRIESLNDYLFIYTDRAIFRAALIQSGGIVSFAFEEIYRGQEGALQYKFAFANAGNAHYYWAENRLVKFTSYDKEPKEPVVLRLCSNSVFDGVTSEDLNFGPFNEEACNNFVGGFNPEFKEIWFSWPTDNSRTGGTDGIKHTCPSMSMVINVTPTEEGVDFFDSGFDAFHWFDGRRQSTLFEFMEDIQVCTREELLPELEKEGLPYDTVTTPAFDSPIQHIWNETEDITLPASDSSLCSAFTEMWLRDICPKCDTLSRFVMASAVDKTLKEYADTSYYREFLEGGAYVLDGYDTVLESGVQDDDADEAKDIIYFAVTGTSQPQTSPNLLYAFVRTGPQPDCMDWTQLKKYEDDCETLSEGLPLSCLTEYSAAEREELGIRQDDFWDWPMEERGRYYGWKLKIEGTGGASCFSRVNFKVSTIG